MKDEGTIYDLNITDRQKNMWNIYTYIANTMNAPKKDESGIMIFYTNIDSESFGGQYAFSNGFVYGRTLSNGSYSGWEKIF